MRTVWLGDGRPGFSNLWGVGAVLWEDWIGTSRAWERGRLFEGVSLIRGVSVAVGLLVSSGAAASNGASECQAGGSLSLFFDDVYSIFFPAEVEPVEVGQAPVPGPDTQVEPAERELSPEEKAALATIRYAEGADYDRLFGWFEDKSRVFDPYTQIGHPNSPYTSSGGSYTSTAAGAYQAMPDTWNEEVQRGTITNDFTPHNQDLFALARLEYRGLLDEVQAGDTSWIDSLQMGYEWASFPNSPYGQPTKSSGNLRSYYYEKLSEYQSLN